MSNHEFEVVEDLEKIIDNFNTNINNEVSQANNRIINEVFEYEKEYLLPLPNNKILSLYLSNRQTRKVAKYSMISFKCNKYSVPVKYIGFDLNVIEKDNSLYIYNNIDLICCYVLRHGFAFSMIKCTDIETTRDLLGQEDIKTTQGYLQTNNSRKENAMQRLSESRSNKKDKNKLSAKKILYSNFNIG